MVENMLQISLKLSPRGVFMCGPVDRYIPVMTSRVYWHRIRYGSVVLANGEEEEIQASSSSGVSLLFWKHSSHVGQSRAYQDNLIYRRVIVRFYHILWNSLCCCVDLLFGCSTRFTGNAAPSSPWS